MSILEKYYHKIIKIDLLNKYLYLNFKSIPKLEKIILNFGSKNSDLFAISSSLLFLELIIKKRGFVTKAKRANVLLKIRKGNLVGCMITLKKKDMYTFLHLLITAVFPNIRDFEGIQILKKKLLRGSFSFTIKDFSCFKEFDKQFYLFSKLPPLNITFLLTTKTEKELLYILELLKVPITEKAIVTQFGRV